jgi:hypothetical protein
MDTTLQQQDHHHGTTPAGHFRPYLNYVLGIYVFGFQHNIK